MDRADVKNEEGRRTIINLVKRGAMKDKRGGNEEEEEDEEG